MKYKWWFESSEGGDGKKSLVKFGWLYLIFVVDSGEFCMGEFEGFLKLWKERDKIILYILVVFLVRFLLIVVLFVDIVC